MNHQKMRLIRLQIGMSQKQLAEKLGISASRLCFFERYGMALPAPTLARLEQIIDGKKPRKKRQGSES